jgi:hypothetical protein
MKKKKMKPTTNEVLLEKIKGLSDLIDERFEENSKAHNALIVQTTKTNGNVLNLEKWMQFSKGAIAILSSIVVPILLYLLYLHIAK